MQLRFREKEVDPVGSWKLAKRGGRCSMVFCYVGLTKREDRKMNNAWLLIVSFDCNFEDFTSLCCLCSP